jgi:SAM-dependent methyltransferase
MKYYPPRFLFRRHEILKRLKRGGNFLEIGPGSLNLTEDILKHYPEGTLVEYNPYVQEIYNGLGKSIRGRLRLVIEDFMSLTTDSKYDCIIACEVMEHIGRDQKFIKKINSLLNDQGQVILSVPSRHKFWSKHDEIVGHLRRYEKQEIKDILSKEDFKNISILSYGFPFVIILRLPRILLAGLQYKQRIRWSKKMQTKQSGISCGCEMPALLGLFCNPYTVYPLCLVSSLFNGYDLSDGYIITAEK